MDCHSSRVVVLAAALIGCGSSDQESGSGNGSGDAGIDGEGAGGSSGSSGAAGSAGAIEQFSVPRLSDCLGSCDSNYAAGRTALETIANSCMCGACASVCGGSCPSGTVDNACAYGCLIPMLHIKQCDTEKTACKNDTDCAKYYACAIQCIAPDSTMAIDYQKMRQACVDRINDYRAMEGVADLARRPLQEPCVDKAAAKDSALNTAHASFKSCGEQGQNECFSTDATTGFTLLFCLENMFMEKFTGVENGGHYQNMVRTTFTGLACGASGNVNTQDFY
jgi:hypothetical protein